MEQTPYSLKALMDELKSKGLDLAEEAAKVAAESVLSWIEKSAVASETKFDDVVAAIIPVVKPYIMEGLDKIDGQVG